jgi:hypothetical protein
VNGDRNTKFVHIVAKIKNKTKLISSLRNEDEIITDPLRISNHIVNYYNALFSTNFVLHESLLVDEVIPSLIDEQTNRLITMLPSTNEIKNVVFNLNSDGHQSQMVLEHHSFKLIGKLFIKKLLKLSLNSSKLVGFLLISIPIL